MAFCSSETDAMSFRTTNFEEKSCIPCNKTIYALGVVNLYLQHVYMRFGLPEKIISDRDPRFASHLYQELGRMLGVKLAMSTTYHPQTDGKTKQVNQELEVYLRMLCSNNPETWKQFLHTAEFTHNQKTHSSMKNSPFYLMIGYHPKPFLLPTKKLMSLPQSRGLHNSCEQEKKP
jgi:transposase InsO family protein